MAVINLPKSSKTADRLSFINPNYLDDIEQELKGTTSGQAVLVGSEDGYTGGRGDDANGRGVAANVGAEVKRELGKLTNVNTKVHVIPAEDGSAHFAALSINRSQPDYGKAVANPRTRNRKTAAKK